MRTTTILAVMVVVLPVPARMSGGLWYRFRVRCAEKKINYGTGFEQAKTHGSLLQLVMTCCLSRLLIQ
ncbi:MAG: hypothetical protein Q8M95_10585 [Candidatus Methanoperedens sp.]|nr:hypothetical protein [Candidatus Methanoperedens sp.]